MDVCAFCQKRAALTGEHVWSNWVNKLLPYRHGYIASRHDKVTGAFVEQFRDKLNLKAKVVCEKCNNTWMSDIENEEAKPLIGPMISVASEFCLTRLGIATLAVFAFKTAVIVDHMRVGRKWAPFFTPRARERFHKLREIPPRVQMYLATRIPDQTVAICNVTYGQVRRGTMRGFETYSMTWAIESFMFQTVCFRWNGKNKGDGNLIQDPTMDEPTPMFWPYLGNVIVWPGKGKIGRDQIDIFSNRWKYLELHCPLPSGIIK